MARDEDDLRFLRSLEGRSSIIVPLRARGRSIGALALSTTERSGRNYDAEDLEFAEGAERPCRPGARQRGPVRRGRDARGAADRRAGQPRRGGDRPEPRRPARVRQRRRRATRIGFASAAGAARDAAAGHRRRVRVLPRGRVAAAASTSYPGAACWPARRPSRCSIRAINRQTGEERWRIVKASRRPAIATGGRGSRSTSSRTSPRSSAPRSPSAPRRGRRGPRVVARLRGDAGAGRRARRSPACRLVRGEHAGRPRRPALGRRRARRPREGRVRPRATTSATRRRSSDEGGAAQVLRDGDLAGHQRHPGRAAERERSPTPSSSRRCASIGMRAVLVVPMVAGRRVIGDAQRSSAPSRGASFTPRPTSSSPRSSAAARAARSRTRGCTPSARRSPARCRPACCPTRCRTSPGFALASLYRPAGAENVVGGDFYDAFPTDVGLDASWSATSPAAARGGGADRRRRATRCAPPRSCSATRWPRSSQLNRALDGAPRPVDLHGRGRRRSCPATSRRRRSCAPATRRRVLRARRRRHAGRADGPDGRRVAGRGVGAPRPSTCARATCSCSTPTACIDAVGERRALRRGAAARPRCTGRRDAARRGRAHPRGARAFERGEQADDTAVLALECVAPGTAARRRRGPPRRSPRTVSRLRTAVAHFAEQAGVRPETAGDLAPRGLRGADQPSCSTPTATATAGDVTVRARRDGDLRRGRDRGRWESASCRGPTARGSGSACRSSRRSAPTRASTTGPAAGRSCA